jgi:ATPase family associated with various cellular activities (AAA)
MEWSMAWAAEPADVAGVGEMADDRIRVSDLAKLARRTRRRFVSAARADERVTLTKLLKDHLGDEVASLDVVEESWPSYDHVNVQIGLDAWLVEEKRRSQLVGLVNFRHQEFGLADLLRSSNDGFPPRPGNVSWVNLASGPDGQVRQCVRAALYLITDQSGGAAVLVQAPQADYGRTAVQLEIVADRPGRAAEIAARVRELALVHNVFRGQVISFGQEMFGERSTVLQFHRRPTMTGDQLILAPDILAVIRRQVVGVAEHREALRAARQHLKRGLLLYGPPGAGKTHTVRYLTSQLTGTTIVELAGDALSAIGTACSVARSLQPAMIVVEDVDLIAEDRGMYPGRHPLLFQLLNEMDGLAEDADVVFLLTTNRADLLEPALAARPGRVDQAVALDLPDAQARRQLFDLYRGDLVVDEARLDSVIERTSGVTASFLKELLRRAALIAFADGEAQLRVSADQLDAALDELMDTRNAMTRVLLGADSERAAHHRRGAEANEALGLVASAQAQPAVAPPSQL